MRAQSRVLSAMALMTLTGAVCSAQSVVSAHSGTVHYFQGDVSIDGAPVQARVGKFAEVKEQSVLSTRQGRAEVLLTPGVFLRIGENSSVRMLDNRLISTRVDILSGTAILESDDPETGVKDSPVTLLYKDYQIQMIKHGLLEITSNPADMKVYKGEAVVTTAGSAPTERVTVHEGRELPFSAALVTEKFDDKVGDDLYLWARDRSESISAANMSSARTINAMSSGGIGCASGLANSYTGNGCGAGGYSGYGYGGIGYGGAWNGGWYYNPYFDMFTYVPASGVMWNAFGYGFFSPGVIYNYYSPSSYWYGAGGSRGTLLTGRTLSGLPSATSRPLPLSTLRTSSAAGAATGPAAGFGQRSPGVFGGSSGGFAGVGGSGVGGGRVGGGGGHVGGGRR